LTIFYVLLAILLLGILVTVHEFGHFIAARLTGIEVVEFAIGFGPKLLGWKSKKYDTQFSLRLIPMGGYCAFYGEDDAEGKTKDDPRAYNKQSVWKRMLTVISGPGMNFVLAFVVLFIFLLFSGVVDVKPDSLYIDSTDPHSAAEAAGIQRGDIILSINGDAVERDLAAESLRSAVDRHARPNEPLHIELLRGEEIIPVELIPTYDETQNRYLLGVLLTYELTDPRTPTLGEALQLSWRNCVNAGSTILVALKNLVTTGEGLEETGGPVGIIHAVTTQTQQGGIDAYLNLMIVLSINLGIMNLLPIPGLDGSRLIFMAIEALRRKPVSQKVESMIHLAGYALLLMLMVFFTFKDVLRIFQ